MIRKSVCKRRFPFTAESGFMLKFALFSLFFSLFFRMPFFHEYPRHSSISESFLGGFWGSKSVILSIDFWMLFSRNPTAQLDFRVIFLSFFSILISFFRLAVWDRFFDPLGLLLGSFLGTLGVVLRLSGSFLGPWGLFSGLRGRSIQPINSSIQPINPSTHQSINSSIQPINPSTHRFNPSTHQLID